MLEISETIIIFVVKSKKKPPLARISTFQEKGMDLTFTKIVTQAPFYVKKKRKEEKRNRITEAY